MESTRYCILVFILCSCVSVSVATKKSVHATGVSYGAPALPFERTSGDNVDAIWRNPKNGNAISYLSDCGDDSDPPLPSIESGVLSGLFPYTYQSQSDQKFEGRAARRVQVTGHVDGVPSVVDLLIFKKNSCIFILSYVGTEQYHAADMQRFDKFISRFHAP